VRVDASDDAPKLDSACVRAFAQSASLEHPALWGGLVDVPSSPGDADLAAVAAELCGPGGEDAMAWRGGQRWVARIQALPAADHQPVLHADASYLVTGGLGALGLQVAAWMARRGARHLVLVGRHAPSPSALQAIAALQRQGVSVVTARADVAVRADLQRVLDDIRPPLRGVVHAAGVFGHAPLDTLELDTIESVLRAKVLGATWLHRLTATLKLDLFVMFSSVAAWWGSKGQAHYAAANAFLDTLASHRAALGQPAISLAWGPWNGAGMATPEAHDWLARIGVRGLAPDDALAAMERHLAGGEPSVAIADVDWPRLREVHSVSRDRPLLACVAPAQAAAPLPPPAASDTAPMAAVAHLTVAERRDWLLGHVQQRVAGVLALDQADGLDVRKGLLDGGGAAKPAGGRLRHCPAVHGGVRSAQHRRPGRCAGQQAGLG
jgi:NAD(P)-dependent dehydrogenase (short-subunit alcohol dehydrogenase family)